MKKSKHTPETDMEDKTNLFKVCFEKGRKMKEKRTAKDDNGDLIEMSIIDSNEPQPEWDEVVEDKLLVYPEEKGGGLYCVDLHGLFYKCFYLGENKIVSHIPVRIKCAKGRILIERLKGVRE